MKPFQLSHALRQIASRIDASKNPSRKRIASDLKKVLNRIAMKYEPGFLISKHGFVDEIKSMLPDADFDKLNDDIMSYTIDIGLQISTDPFQNNDKFEVIEVTPGSLKVFLKACADAASERPDEDLDVVLACLHGAKVEPIDVEVDIT